MSKKVVLVFVIALMGALGLRGQDAAELPIPFGLQGNDMIIQEADSTGLIILPLDSLPPIEVRDMPSLPVWEYGPVVFDRYYMLDSISVPPTLNTFHSFHPEALQWLDDELFRDQLIRTVKQRYIIDHPQNVKYNAATLPEPPPVFKAVVDPRDHKLKVQRIKVEEALKDAEVTLSVDRKDWIHTFEGSLQFSQSYLSPNWYQGGNGNLNAIANAVWNVKLNPAFHPNVMFETTVQYKLAVNNAPDDSLHRYNISEDLFRVTSKFGIKAAKRWFYSVNLQFKTQMLNNYKKNTNTIQAAFLSPGELNVGLGMTYNYVSPSEKFKFDASISPIAWNMKTCINNKVDPTTLGMKAGEKVDNQIGTNLECKMTWQLAKNISWSSRLFMFTDYTYVQGDWENTFKFDINRFLATQIYVHLRYDSSVTPLPEATWRYWQLKEVLSFGFSYKFG